MNQPPLFSIVIPTYNRESFILKTLQTVFDQRFRDFEVIVVDNASTDNTVKLLEPLVSQGKIRLITHDKNYERARSRNTGQLEARGLYLTFLDSDDLMYPDNLQDAADFISANTEIQFFHNLYELVDENGKVVYRYPFPPITNVHQQIAKGNFLSCIGVFLHREVYSNIRWDETPVLVGSEDYDFWLRVLARVSNLGRIHKINSGILHHPGRTMNQLDLNGAILRIEFILQKIRGDRDLFNCYKPYFSEMKGSLYLFLSGLASRTNIAQSFAFLMQAVGAYPGLLVSKSFYSAVFVLLSGRFKREK